MWLRHDVEIDPERALLMARAEVRLNVRSSYFVCVESPFLAHKYSVRDMIASLVDLGHHVSFHIVLRPGLAPVWERVEVYAEEFHVPVPAAVTFHAPGLPVDVLAQAPGGQDVYRPLASQVGAYHSDSTGRWRWGHPMEQSVINLPTQLLTHPYWWGGDWQSLIARCQSRRVLREFFPQLTANE